MSTEKSTAVAEQPEAATLNRSIAFVLERTTKGAARYQEVDGAGNVLELAAAVIGTVYVRKAVLPGGRIPQRVTVTIAESS